ncbi:bifunctional [glutamine synthetase] adenylyltransferase/[glutamine synthetase]-adenylyl-L-tyrosine phosphorylase [Dactylosporangium sp. AC04546]|uniref:bifunctional [glutamine synthetase] adenylyltransferase/[glutamine synthetase]-adenylyl-L-tyrosine phosphorylase n=1 Tax=Dactylosporangium sp. AC04546 TaxID=2862460 RepID=UPI001EDD7DE1|nr:bifunctional [glutamine synthetase] adenylyltransferase/[glutamine synthetase]-adenylyl-L-tyrosine phosphorylase [Dactylosporangium sp. AC04546]WVK82255.1 bifunctional [glutamine synthetase] adenylyltransferase/[glutamine synthetase]-adenylyl-L-tyrosine phosphorylase [Dactylosporangium sp. AC04546]
MATHLARFGFTDGDRAELMTGPDGLRLWDPAAGKPVDEDAASILDTLYFAADPDLALFQLHRLYESAGEELRTEVLTDRALRRRLIGVLGVSATLGDLLVANPGEWRELQGEQNHRAAGYATREVSTVPSLRQGYRRELLRIVAADLTAAADVEVTMRRLTELADATLVAALGIAVAEAPDHAAACRLAVIAMGKCGGQELNYVSDVDVVFVAEPASDDVEVEVAMRAGSALAARMMEICGFVAWPVDAALRPEGSRGALVRTVASHLAYYKKWAKTWEFQALLKARPAAGDQALGEQWLAELQPLIWAAAERPEAVDEVRAMRRRIIESIPRAEVEREIKRGPGGLRDIEFAVQLLQLVHGRADESLRTPTTLAGLRALIEGGYVGLADGEALLRAYRFLRVVEHRLQLQRLRRTHTVPDDPDALRWLAHALGYRPSAARDAVESFRADWVRHAGEVRRLHAKLFYRPLLEAVARVPSEQLRLTPDAARARLEVLGFADPAGALRHLQALTGGVSRTAAIQRQLLPALLSEFADAPEPDRGLLAYRQVSEKVGNTPWYLRLLRDEGPVALRLARLLALSRYVTELLVHDPEALRLLADDTELVPRSAETLTEGFAAAAARHPDPETAINAVRALRRRELFRIAAADLLGQLDVTEVGTALSAVIDATLRATLGVTAALAAPLPFAIIGMGRLGGHETSYPSDADVLFVYEPPPGMADDAASGAALTVAEELRRLLARPAHDPPLGVDADLRPEGRQGPLVRSLGAYRQYYTRWSSVWEAQALLRARYVAGDEDLAARFLAIADTKRFPDGGLTREQIHEIRRLKARVDSERLPRGADPATHTKLGRGGLTDVEWTVQLLQLRHGSTVPPLRTTRTLEALSAAAAADLVTEPDAAALRAAWRQASQVRNLMTLVRGRASDQLPRQGPDLAAAARVLGHGVEPQEFLDEYLRVARHARQAVERIYHP